MIFENVSNLVRNTNEVGFTYLGVEVAISKKHVNMMSYKDGDLWLDLPEDVLERLMKSFVARGLVEEIDAETRTKMAIAEFFRRSNG